MKAGDSEKAHTAGQYEKATSAVGGVRDAAATEAH